MKYNIVDSNGDTVEKEAVVTTLKTSDDVEIKVLLIEEVYECNNGYIRCPYCAAKLDDWEIEFDNIREKESFYYDYRTGKKICRPEYIKNGKISPTHERYIEVTKNFDIKNN